MKFYNKCLYFETCRGWGKKSLGFHPEHVIIRLTLECILCVNASRIGMGKDFGGCSVAEVSSEAFLVEGKNSFHSQGFGGGRESTPCTEA